VGGDKTNWRPQLIALDIDGTLTDHHSLGHVNDKAKDAIKQAQDAGIHVVIATGRALSTTLPIAQEAGINEWVISSNGAILANIDGHIHETVTFNAQEAIQLLDEELPDAVFALEDQHSDFHSTHWFSAGALCAHIEVTPLEEFAHKPAVRLVVRSDSMKDEGFGPLMRKHGFHTTIFGVDQVAWVDIGPTGVTKAFMLEQLAKQLNISQNHVMAIGDSQNDLEMLQWAGKGVAMGAAKEHIVAAANEVTSHVPGDGVADAILRWM